MSIAASTDDVGSGTDGDVHNTAVVADIAVAVVAAGVAGVAAVAAGVGAVAVADDDDHGDVDDDGTSRYYIHPCHVPESRFIGSNTSAIRTQKTKRHIHRWQTYQSAIGKARLFVPGSYRTASAAFPCRIRGVFRYYSNKARERL